MSFAPSSLVDFSPRPAPRGHRFASEGVRLLACKVAAFFADEGCRAIPFPDFRSVTVDINGLALTLEILGPHDQDPQTPRRVAVRSVEEARAAAVLAGILGTHASGAAA